MHAFPRVKWWVPCVDMMRFLNFRIKNTLPPHRSLLVQHHEGPRRTSPGTETCGCQEQEAGAETRKSSGLPNSSILYRGTPAPFEHATRTVYRRCPVLPGRHEVTEYIVGDEKLPGDRWDPRGPRRSQRSAATHGLTRTGVRTVARRRGLAISSWSYGEWPSHTQGHNIFPPGLR